MNRWHATIDYRLTHDSAVQVEHDLAEIADLHELVELGPHWDTIEKIELFRINHVVSAELTVAAAEKLR